MVQRIMILSDGAGNSWRVDRDAIMPVLEREHMPLPPCPRGWSQHDYLFGAGDECAVPVLLREAGIWFSIVSCGLMLSSSRQRGVARAALLLLASLRCFPAPSGISSSARILPCSLPRPCAALPTRLSSW